MPDIYIPGGKYKGDKGAGGGLVITNSIQEEDAKKKNAPVTIFIMYLFFADLYCLGLLV